MAACELLDFRCILVNEIVGNVVLAVVLIAILYFVVTNRLKFGFDTTIAFAVPIILLAGLAVGGFSVIFAFLTFVTAIMIAWLFDRIIGNK
ncbi:hypothetical protein LCGC14_0476490 [marine sediment metagenome]|uniref:Uncharacterized protein n=1 Tax=marine sediment metagenome TaxID=412755 RepID=A0A0F9UXM2_9ZZZZ